MRSHQQGNGTTTRALALRRGVRRIRKSLITTTTLRMAITNPGARRRRRTEGGGSSSGSGETAPTVTWPPEFVIGLTNREKEEDFMAIKGSKLPQRPKKRAKFVQRTLNLVSPGTWLCDLTLEWYEVREKVSKKRPQGLKAMGNMMESDSE